MYYKNIKSIRNLVFYLCMLFKEKKRMYFRSIDYKNEKRVRINDI